MFDNLKDKLQSVFSSLGKRGALSEGDVDAALREVRLALLEADVALPVVKSFITSIREKAVGDDRAASGWRDGRRDQKAGFTVDHGVSIAIPITHHAGETGCHGLQRCDA